MHSESLGTHNHDGIKRVAGVWTRRMKKMPQDRAAGRGAVALSWATQPLQCAFPLAVVEHNLCFLEPDTISFSAFPTLAKSSMERSDVFSDA